MRITVMTLNARRSDYRDNIGFEKKSHSKNGRLDLSLRNRYNSKFGCKKCANYPSNQNHFTDHNNYSHKKEHSRVFNPTVRAETLANGSSIAHSDPVFGRSRSTSLAARITTISGLQKVEERHFGSSPAFRI